MSDSSKQPVLRGLAAADWLTTREPWHGFFEGDQIGANVTVLYFTQEQPGDGPGLHVHAYEEIFIIRRGRARFTVGDAVMDAGEGDVVVGPAHVPHKFENLGPGPLETIDIHMSPRWVQVDLDDPADDRASGVTA